jgi:hypothetical protein
VITTAQAPQAGQDSVGRPPHPPYGERGARGRRGRWSNAHGIPFTIQLSLLSFPRERSTARGVRASALAGCDIVPSGRGCLPLITLAAAISGGCDPKSLRIGMDIVQSSTDSIVCPTARLRGRG